MTQELYGFDALIESFLNKEISVEKFERAYLDKYLEDEDPEDEQIFRQIEWLFFEVDAYTDLPLEPGDDPEDHINEDQLRDSAAKTLQKLKELEARG